MATLLELNTLVSSSDSSDLRKKIIAAITIKANAVVDSASPTAAALAWAKAALADPRAYEQLALHTALASNSGATVAQIVGASDASLQTIVNGVVDKLLAV